MFKKLQSYCDGKCKHAPNEPIAKCNECQQAGMFNCSNFDVCGNVRCRICGLLFKD